MINNDTKKDGKSAVMEQRARQIGIVTFYIAHMLEMLFVLLDKSAYIIPYETWAFRLTFIMFAFKIICTKYTRREWICIFAFGLLGIISFIATDREEIIRVVAFVAAFKDINIRTAAKVTFYETLIGSLLIVLLSVAGIYGAVSVTANFRGGGIEETRYCLGMGHPNALHCMVFVLLVLGMALYQEYLKWYGYLLLFFLNIGVFSLTDSRTGVLLSAAAIIFAAFLHYAVQFRENKVIYIIGMVFVLFCVLFTVFISIYGVDIHILRQIDIRINGRFQWGKSEGGIQYWSLFSNPSNQNYMDMGYMKLFYWYGIIPTLLYITVICRLIWECYRKKAYGAYLVTMMFSAYTLIEAHAVSVYIGRNYILLFIGAMWYTVLGQAGGEEYFFHIGRLLKRKRDTHAEYKA